MNGVTIWQENNCLFITFHSSAKNINCLYLRNEYHEMKYLPVRTDEQSFEIDLREAADAFSYYHSEKVFFIVEKTNGMLTNQEKLTIKKYDAKIFKLQELACAGTNFYPYLTVNGFFQFSFSDALPAGTYLQRRHIDDIRIKNNTCSVAGKFTTINSHLENASMIITSRLSDTETEIKLPKTIYQDFKKSKKTTYQFQLNIENELIDYAHQAFDPEDIIDIFLQINVQEFASPIRIKLGNPRVRTESFLKGELTTPSNEKMVTLTPYFTIKGRNLSFKINSLSPESFDVYTKLLKKSINVKRNRHNKIWVIGEKYYKAQDNGYHFFKHMRTNHPEKPVYYIIDKQSEEYKNVQDLGNVIDFQSPEHFKIMLMADYICTTHHPELIFPTSNYKYVKKVKAKRIFLQHGVLGVKNLTQINGKQLHDFNVDLFVTSSEREKQIVVRDLKFDRYQVKATGLPRFDELFRDNGTNKKQILIIPTWRDWLTQKEKLLQSEYLERINHLLNSSMIQTLARQGISVVFCLHPNMQPFIDLFDVPSHVQPIKQGEVSVQKLIKESSLMITDYSSVAFDFSFLKKPVIYYQFDKNRFLGNYPSHLDIENELPGTIVNNQLDLETALQHFYDADFTIDETLKRRINRFNPYQDSQNSERLFQEITSFVKKNRVKDFLRYHILVNHVYTRFRKSKHYFKVMSRYNTLMTRFTRTDNQLILFESNIGKSVGDNPKFIYDELKRRNLNYKIVWVTNKLYPFDDPNVISVERFSPRYFRYLSKAKYWVNNQNFPYYIRKSANTKYLQTWHGTPLKKMLNDVDQFQGRDAGYKDRVNTAISKWDYLISSSPYTTRHFRSAFAYSNEIWEVGYPRNDRFYQQDDALIKGKEQIIKQRLGIPEAKKIILYAPTFRDDEINAAKKNTINLQLDLHKLKRELGEEYVVLLRPHIIVSNALKLDASLDGFVVNVAKYNEMSDLLLISDICITDYSSVMFDFANTKRPLIFFTYDLNYYKHDLRDFYMDFEAEAPGPLVFTNDQLVSALKNIETVQQDYKDKYEAFYRNYCTFETGTSSEQIVTKLLES